MLPSLTETLSDLVRINSINPAYPGGPGEAELQDYVERFFTRHGLQTQRQAVFPHRDNVVATLPGRMPGQRLVFEAHVDTAGIQGMTIAPFEPEVRGGRLYGRGACDTKAGLAAMMLALADLQQSGVAPPCEICVAATVDEEETFRGVVKLCDGLTARAAVVSEPTELKMVVASKGCLRWRIRVSGKAAHSSKPHLGVNAIQGMAHVLLALEGSSGKLKELRHRLVGSPTFNVGRIQGGAQVNIVPEECLVEIDRRLIPGEDPDQVRSSYERLLDDVRRERPEVHVEMEDPSVVDLPLDTPEDSSLVRTMSAVLRRHGLMEVPTGVDFGSDASKLARQGIPSIIFGPGSIDQAHTADEYVELSQVEQAFLVYRDLMRQFE